jgi:uncharacterized membrane protein
MEHVLPRPDRKMAPQKRLLYGVAGGALLTFGLRQRSFLGGLAALVGTDLVANGATGHHLHEFLGAVEHLGPGGTRIPHQIGVQVQRSVLVNTTPEKAYEFVRNLENLPRFLKHLKNIQISDEKRSHWTVRGPRGKDVEWDAEIITDTPGELLSWRSLDHPDVKSAGSVHFERAIGNRGSIVRVRLQYLPIGGALRAFVGKLFGDDPDLQLADDLRRLKQVLETGEIATTQGQPRGGLQAAQAYAPGHHEIPQKVPQRRRAATAS